MVFTSLMDKEQDVYSDQEVVPGLPTSYLIDRDGSIGERIRNEREGENPDIIKKYKPDLLDTKKEKT